MAFKTFDCYTTGIVSVDPSNWSTNTDTIIITGTSVFFAGWPCDPELSKFTGSASLPPRMTLTDFYEMFGLIVGLMIIGVIFKMMRKQF